MSRGKRITKAELAEIMADAAAKPPPADGESKLRALVEAYSAAEQDYHTQADQVARQEEAMHRWQEQRRRHRL